MTSFRTRGFTLVEIMIVIAVLALLAAIAIPAYNGHIKRSRVSALVQNWQTAVSTLHAEAAYLGTPGTLCRDLIVMLNEGTKRAVGNGSLPAFTTSGNDAGTVVIDGLGDNHCPDEGETVTITAYPAPGTDSADYPGGSIPSISFSIE